MYENVRCDVLLAFKFDVLEKVRFGSTLLLQSLATDKSSILSRTRALVRTS